MMIRTATGTCTRISYNKNLINGCSCQKIQSPLRLVQQKQQRLTSTNILYHVPIGSSLLLLHPKQVSLSLLLSCATRTRKSYDPSIVVATAIRRILFSTTTTTNTTGTRTSSTTITTDVTRKVISTPQSKYSIKSIFAIVFSCTTLYSIKYFYDNVSGGTINGLYRSIIFYSFAIPKYILYRYHMIYSNSNTNSNDKFWDELNTKTAQSGLQKILLLQGFYIKCGQLCASNIGNAFPPIWQSTMSILQDQCPYQDYNTIIQNIIKKEYNISSIHDIFESIDPIPIGSASIGQVHRAILNIPNNIDTNDTATKNKTNTTKNVVIKICYPNVEEQLRGDVQTIKLFAQIAQPVHVPGIIEIQKQFATEFDYTIEGQHLHLVRSNLINAGYCTSTSTNDDKAKHNNNNNNSISICRIPKPYLKYCTKRVLVMEELYGEKLVVALKKNAIKISKITGMTMEELLEKQSQQINSSSTSSSSSHNYKAPISAAEYDRINRWIERTGKIRYVQSYLSNNLLSWFPYYNNTNNNNKHDIDANKEMTTTTATTDSKTIDYDWPLLNPAKLVDDLFEIHGYEVLVNGVFNSDPHPGNILLCKSESGQPQLGLIDYGQVKHISKETRHLFAQLILALDADDKESIVQLMIKGGYKSKYMNPHNIYLYAKVYYDENSIELTNGLHPQLFIEQLQSSDPIYTLPEEFIAIGRTSMVLRGLADALYQHRRISHVWKKFAQRILKENI